MTGRRVFFYVQHLLGIGHLARASRIAASLVAHAFDVTMAAGGMPVPGFPGPGLKTVDLPPVKAGAAGFSALEDARGVAVTDDFKARRRGLLLAAFRACHPDILIIEAFPFGRRQMRFELLPLLEAAHAMAPRPAIVSSVRDILQETHKPGRAEETVGLVERWFDAVFVHGDPAFATLEETFPLAARFARKLRYTGLVAGPPPEPASERFDVVVSAGGGAAGQTLLDASLAAARGREGESWCVIAGPHLPQPAYDRLAAAAPPHVRLDRFRPDLPGLIAAARLSVSQAGYNTVGDILRARCRAVLVPFAEGGETEQTTRAARLAALGLATVVTEAQLGTGALAEAIDAALSGPLPPAHGLNLDGAPNTAKELARDMMPSA